MCVSLCVFVWYVHTYSPVNMVERYMSMAAVNPASEQFLFRGITKSGAGKKLELSGGLSYTTLRE